MLPLILLTLASCTVPFPVRSRNPCEKNGISLYLKACKKCEGCSGAAAGRHIRIGTWRTEAMVIHSSSPLRAFRCNKVFFFSTYFQGLGSQTLIRPHKAFNRALKNLLKRFKRPWKGLQRAFERPLKTFETPEKGLISL